MPGHLARVDAGAPVVTIPARQARAFRAIDNRTSELTSWNTDLLPDALAGLDDLDIFSFDDVLPSTATAGKTDPDDIPETPKNPVSRVGDIWTLGKHRLMCGDATKPEHRLRHRDRARLRGRDGDTVGRLHGPEGQAVDKVTQLKIVSSRASPQRRGPRRGCAAPPWDRDGAPPRWRIIQGGHEPDARR